ncbi:shikimate dehydrogenase [Thermobifida fusca]|uniref:Shikimate dehydrogenase n=2 Tax=Thermobifida fusca TaxID=2021 RepID=A0A9P2TAD4_THEFU|nr:MULTISPECIES: shikimate dehydrogenase [Thermobifida]AAZ56100.1 shikimate dehydrogenase [Thermobifida fusca YX]EOR70829.1 shikimate dehydrogenase [Thermobifida fusca TM51]MBO2530176.1 shikimate dehydrogenase [Thermobifida sp.]MDD6790928.1 shikimate dehydrogenase [Thermobifida fusca]PPS94375.1 shikimate dehydrogenase [Thermobifida fusca]
MKRAAVLGSPISHSLSPVLHTAGYTALGIADQWHYGRYECDEHGLAAFLDQCDESWAGLSLTMPLKKVALTLADEVEDTAAAVGGANTIIFDKGRRHAYNTDVTGITEALREAGIHRLDTVTILGAGATAASALAAVRRLGATEPGAVTVLARDLSRTRDLAAAAERMGAQVKFALLTEIDQHVHADLVVSTLPAGAADQWAEPVAAAKTPVFDVVYAPWPTVLGSAAAAAGAVVVGGFPMLLHQAVAQLTLMTGYEAPVEAMRAAGEAELARRAARNNLDT